MPRKSTTKKEAVDTKSTSRKARVSNSKTIRSKTKTEKVFRKKPSTARAVNAKANTRSKNNKVEPRTIKLPSNMSLRAQDKTLSIATLLTNNSEYFARSVALAFGYFLILAGALASIVYINNIQSTSLSAMVCEAGINCSMSTSSVSDNGSAITESVVSNSSAPTALPELDFQTGIPSQTNSLLRVNLQTSHADRAQVYLESQSNNNFFLVESFDNFTDVVQVLIDPEKYPTDIYKIRVKLWSVNIDTYAWFSSAAINFINRTELVDGTTDVTETTQNDDNEADAENETVNETEPEKNTTKKVDIVISDEDNANERQMLADESSLKTTSEDPRKVEDNVTEVGAIQANTDTTLDLTRKPEVSRLSNGNLLITQVIPDAQFVEVYARQYNSTNSLFLGLARKGTQNLWLYTHNNEQLPTGRYGIYLKVKLATRIITTNENIFEHERSIISNNRITDSNSTTPKPMIDKSPKEIFGPGTSTRTTKPNTNVLQEPIDTNGVEAQQASSEFSVRSTYFSDYINENSTKETTVDVTAEEEQLSSNETVPISIRVTKLQKVKTVLSTQDNRVNEILKQYASSIQTNDPILKERVRMNIDELTEDVMAEMMQENKSDESLSAMRAELEETVEELKLKVRRFESLVIEKTKTDSIIDTDGDGISDYDEINLYGTDPNSSDTDNDGYLDAVEITGGFDPLDSTNTEIKTYASPKEIGFVAEDYLIVEKVSPLIENDEDRGLPRVQTQIKGKALPNSFVTIFIFSEPTIVNIKTGDDGSFEYTFTKELEDGSHEIYLAITDNTGDIVAKSLPFEFIKTAEAFTVLSAQAQENRPVISSPQNETAFGHMPYVVVSISVLTFGIILILLGNTLARREDKQTLITGS